MDYNKVCWNCGSDDLKDMGGFVKCQDCGATHNELPKPAAPLIAPSSTVLLTKTGPVRVRGLKLTASAKRRVAKAREKAKVQ